MYNVISDVMDVYLKINTWIVSFLEVGVFVFLFITTLLVFNVVFDLEKGRVNYLWKEGRDGG